MSKIKNEMNQIDKNEAGEINIADKVFLKYVKNTIEDFIRSNQLEMVENLIPIYRDKKLSLWNIKYLVELLLTREENLDSLVLQQDKKIYNLLNNEHKYMRKYLNKWFVFSRIPNSEMIEITRK